MNQENFFIQLLSPHSLVPKTAGMRILNSLLTDLRVKPDFYENWEPIKTEFKSDELDTVLEHWKYPFLWKTKRNVVSGSIGMRGGKIVRHGTIKVCDKKKSIPESDCISFLRTMSQEFVTDFSFVHLLAEGDLGMGAHNETVMPVNIVKRTNFNLFVTTHELRKYIPDLYWGTVFGPAYVRLFGKEKLLSAPAYLVEDWGEEMVYIQLSESYMDMKDKFEAVDAVRKAVKAHLDSNAFFEIELGTEHAYNVPEFQFID